MAVHSHHASLSRPYSIPEHVGAQVLPMLKTISLFKHIGDFLIILIPLWVLAAKNPAHAVFAHFVNNGGWNNPGTSCLVAQVTVLYYNLGKMSLG